MTLIFFIEHYIYYYFPPNPMIIFIYIEAHIHLPYGFVRFPIIYYIYILLLSNNIFIYTESKLTRPTGSFDAAKMALYYNYMM